MKLEMKRSARWKLAPGLLALAAICSPAVAFAQDAQAQPGHGQGGNAIVDPAPAAPRWFALSNDRLANLRGGYRLPSGLLVSFGIERAAYVNGVLVSSTSLNIPDVSNMTTKQATDLAALTGPMVVQLGEGNTFNPGGAMTGVVIQNTLDNQAISTFTTLNISVGTLGLFQDLNSYTALQNALINVPGGL